nr:MULTISPECIES: protein jag [unclassified Rhodococcus (in: high G+C Gram-positive bacteria)]
MTIDSKTDEQSTPEVEASADDTVVAAVAVTPESDTEADEPEGDAEDYLVEEGEIAGDYLEQLLDVLDFDGDIDLDVEGDRAVVSIDGGKDLNKLVGRKGEVLDALQELTRLAVQQSTGDRSKLMLDVAGWRAGRREELTRLGTEAAERVAASGDSEPLEPMTPFERKIVHDAVATVAGVTSESDGVEPNRHVVVVKE